MFNQPLGGGGFFKPAEHNGHLILIRKVDRIERRFDTLRNAEIDQATVDLVDLDDPAQELCEGVAVTHVGIVNKLKPGATNILGRIAQVTTKSGMQAWALQSYAEGVDDVRAQQWVDRQGSGFAQPPAAADSWTAPAPPAPAAAAPEATGPALGTLPDGRPITPEMAALLQQLGGTQPAA